MIVCVHGLSRQGRDFDVLAQALLSRAAQPLRVVCPDVVGRGRSDWLADPMGYQVPGYAADMLPLLAQLHAQAPVSTLDWVGTSMGGLIGMALCGTPEPAVAGAGAPAGAQRRRARHPVAGAAAHRHLPGQHRALREPAAGRRRDVGDLDQLRPAHARAVAGAVAADGQAAAGGRLHAALRPGDRRAVPHRRPRSPPRKAQAALWQLYDNIRAETLLTRGAESDLLSPETAQAMTQRGPHARLVEFEGVGHAPTFVTDNQVEAVASFLLRPDSAHEKPDSGTS